MAVLNLGGFFIQGQMKLIENDAVYKSAHIEAMGVKELRGGWGC